MRSSSADLPLRNAPATNVWFDTSRICRNPYQLTAMMRVSEMRCMLTVAPRFPNLHHRHPLWPPSVGTNQRPAPIPLRSEEHTSELQSLTNLVCRLLLEKKTI